VERGAAVGAAVTALVTALVAASTALVTALAAASTALVTALVTALAAVAVMAAVEPASPGKLCATASPLWQSGKPRRGTSRPIKAAISEARTPFDVESAMSAKRTCTAAYLPSLDAS